MADHAAALQASVVERVAVLKSLAAAALTGAARSLPVGARKAVLRGLVSRTDGYEIFQALGRSYGVSDIRVSGDYGMIEGSIEDGVMLQAYARTKSWSSQKNGFFIDFFRHSQGGTYLDIGANIGLTTIPIAQNPAVSCKAFEPDPSNFGYLRSNVLKNCRHGNVEVMNLALFDRRTTLDFELSDQNGGDHRVRLDARDGSFGERYRSAIKVPAERLDDVLSAPSLVLPIAAKIVAQGAESHIVAGGRSLLGQTDVIALQFYPYALERLRGDAGLLTEFLADHFTSGALMIGDQDKEPAWTSTATLADEMRRLARDGHDRAYDYYHVFARK